MTDARISPVVLERTYVWELPVRLTHWLIFLCVIILSATGYYIGHPFIEVPDPAKDHFVMGTARAVHDYTAIVFTLTVLVRFYWLFAGNSYARVTEFIPVSRHRWRSLWKTMLYYSFIRREPDEYLGHNALAGASYVMIFAVYLLMIATGLALHSVDTEPGSLLHVFNRLVPLFDGLQNARLIHHIGMWVVLLFVIVHVYFVFLSSVIEHFGTFDSIFSGYKFTPRPKADVS